MSITYKDGAIVSVGPFHVPALYDISNNLLTAQFDGRGNIVKYSVINKWNFTECWYNIMYFNGAPLDQFTQKTTEMMGRIQRTSFSIPEADVEITQFADSRTNAVFSQFKVKAKTDVEFENVFNMGLDYTSYLKNFFTARLSLKNFNRLIFGTLGSVIRGMKKTQKHGSYIVFRNRNVEKFYFDVAMPEGSEALESNPLHVNQFSSKFSIAAGEEKNLRIVVSMGTKGDFSETDAAVACENFDSALAEAQAYCDSLVCPPSCDTEFLKAYYKNLLNCSLSMYKEMGRFKGFLAGVNYQSPARTYFRDGYWTVLSVLPVRPELVRNEILTLAGGVDKDGKCPSAVKYNFRNFWGNHFDSPSFFVIMLYDYVRVTGDKGILDEKWRGKTILDAAELVLARLSQYEDETGMLYKAGPYNRRDWCDNVFREGYCTYDEALYVRALEGLAYLLELKGRSGEKAAESAQKCKSAINSLLWDSKLGYYVNYKDKNRTEDNLSIDTVITVLFGIADEERARSVLSRMEALLETRNNKLQKAGDFGTLSVFPFYKFGRDVVLKSSYPFYYHNGGDWPYWSAVYSYAKLKYGMDYLYPLTRWFEYNTAKGNYTPMEFFSPLHPEGSLLQAWSSAGAFVLSYPDGSFFDPPRSKE